ncbi:hypothetical protein D918_05055 [Trichuris suis]|nr:hypothetical protein D918_05055 [Trichuris suis]
MQLWFITVAIATLQRLIAYLKHFCWSVKKRFAARNAVAASNYFVRPTLLSRRDTVNVDQSYELLLCDHQVPLILAVACAKYAAFCLAYLLCA